MPQPAARRAGGGWHAGQAECGDRGGGERRELGSYRRHRSDQGPQARHRHSEERGLRTMAIPVRQVDADASAAGAVDATEARASVLGTYRRPPMEIVRGEGVYLIDSTGRRYLDFVSGIAVNALGYSDA